jgi:gas vesicle protein
MDKKNGGFLDVLLLGGIVGAAIAVLFTPFSGEDARKKLKEKIDEVKNVPKEAAEDIKANSPETIAKTIESIEEGINRISSAIEEAKAAAEEKRKEMDNQ